MPYLTKKVLPNGSDQFVKGFYETQEIGSESDVQMHVSRGIGLIKYPLRFLNVPETTEVNLIRKE